MICMKSRPRGTLQQEFQDHVLKADDRVGFIVKELKPYADAYETVTGASYESTDGSGEVNKYLRCLNQLDNFDWIPPAMAFYRRNQRPRSCSFASFETWNDWPMQCSSYGRTLIGVLPYTLTSCAPSIKRRTSMAFRRPFNSRPKKYRTFCVRWTAPSAPSRECAGPCFCALIRYWQTGAPDMSIQPITVEHVLPRKPERNSQWLIDFPDDEERAEWTDRLANLVLLSRTKNSSALNHDFERKKREYFQRGGVVTFALTTQVLSETEWTPEVLQRRQRELINALKKEWRLEEATPLQPRKDSQDKGVVTNPIHEQTRQLVGTRSDPR